MYKYHTTINGESMLICEMSNNHLINTINLYLRKLEAVLKIANQSENISEYQKVLYNRQVVDQGMAADATKEVADKLEPYVMEAVLRNIDGEFREFMQIVFDRKEAVSKIQKIMSLNACTVYPIDNDDNEDLEF